MTQLKVDCHYKSVNNLESGDLCHLSTKGRGLGALFLGCSSGQNARCRVRLRVGGRYLRVVDGLRFPSHRYRHIASYRPAVRRIRGGYHLIGVPRGTVSGRSRTRTWITCMTEWCSFFRTTEISTACAQSQFTWATPTTTTTLFLDDSACLVLLFLVDPPPSLPRMRWFPYSHGMQPSA